MTKVDAVVANAIMITICALLALELHLRKLDIVLFPKSFHFWTLLNYPNPTLKNDLFVESKCSKCRECSKP